VNRNPFGPQPGDVTVHLDEDGRVPGIDGPHWPPPPQAPGTHWQADARGDGFIACACHVGKNHAEPWQPLDLPVETVRVELDANGSGAYPSLYLVEVVPGDVVTYILSADSLPDVRRMSWRTRAILRGYCDRLVKALDEAQ